MYVFEFYKTKKRKSENLLIDFFHEIKGGCFFNYFTFHFYSFRFHWETKSHLSIVRCLGLESSLCNIFFIYLFFIQTLLHAIVYMYIHICEQLTLRRQAKCKERKKIVYFHQNYFFFLIFVYVKNSSNF